MEIEKLIGASDYGFTEYLRLMSVLAPCNSFVQFGLKRHLHRHGNAHGLRIAHRDAAFGTGFGEDLHEHPTLVSEKPGIRGCHVSREGHLGASLFALPLEGACHVGSHPGAFHPHHGLESVQPVHARQVDSDPAAAAVVDDRILAVPGVSDRYPPVGKVREQRLKIGRDAPLSALAQVVSERIETGHFKFPAQGGEEDFEAFSGDVAHIGGKGSLGAGDVDTERIDGGREPEVPVFGPSRAEGEQILPPARDVHVLLPYFEKLFHIVRRPVT